MSTPQNILNQIREVLWPEGDMDHEWDSETVDEVAAVLISGGYGPTETCRHYQDVPGKEGQSCEACREGEKEEDTAEELMQSVLATGPQCPHSACSQHYIETGDASCIAKEEDDDTGFSTEGFFDITQSRLPDHDDEDKS